MNCIRAYDQKGIRSPLKVIISAGEPRASLTS